MEFHSFKEFVSAIVAEAGGYSYEETQSIRDMHSFDLISGMFRHAPKFTILCIVDYFLLQVNQHLAWIAFTVICAYITYVIGMMHI